MIVIEDEPTATAGGVSETTLPDPATTPQSGPQRSPQRKYLVSFLLLAVHECSFFAINWLFVCVGAEQLH